MEWNRIAIRGLQNVYNDEAKKIDEQILRLVQQRKSVAEGQQLFPDPELMQQWSNDLGLELSEISLVLGSLNQSVPRRHFWEEPGELRGVLPIMKTTRDGDFEYALTHSMQYENLSILSVEIKCLTASVESVSIEAPLTLAILGEAEYEVQMHGGRGGGAQVEMRFLIWPPLPEALDSIEFSLVPDGRGLRRPRHKEVTLDKRIDF
ncbi:hypothetical protein MKX70_02640 [Paenibacillus sp. FSL R7-0312]|uniref:hypothetical protein n=1 Tax=unclassified Paenibacillus TaxID=185978 RepID=UPI0004F75553|nr:hypothetical protein [Paenibacillus sp. FSL R5-0912]AIQ39172.1 hypothetical protein R50912_03245 [Paenibacillus sp. FSL R5-0912]